jgi:hypothetical protein
MPGAQERAGPMVGIDRRRRDARHVGVYEHEWEPPVAEGKEQGHIERPKDEDAIDRAVPEESNREICVAILGRWCKQEAVSAAAGDVRDALQHDAKEGVPKYRADVRALDDGDGLGPAEDEPAAI